MENERVWLGEPPEWSEVGDTITVRTRARTDFWCRTGQDDLTADDWSALNLEPPEYVVDNGHFLYEVAQGDFIATARVSGDFNAQYDQVGLMVRQDADNWLKSSVEVFYGGWSERYQYSNPAHLVGCTLTTDGWSAFSPLPESETNPTAAWIRVTREGATFWVDYSGTGERFDLINNFSMPGARDVMVGLYATSPTGDGFDAQFDHYSLVKNR